MRAESTRLLTSVPDLAAVLDKHGRLGFFGPEARPEDLVTHALRFAAALRPGRILVDLGSGGGVPGLVLACALPSWQVVLVEGSGTRADALRRAVGRLRLGARVVVDGRPATVVARDPQRRGHADAVVARSFGPPAVTAEAAAPLLRPGGQLLVSEPPEADDRWPRTSLAVLGLEPDDVSPPGLRSLTQVAVSPERFPRRRLRPPLF